MNNQFRSPIQHPFGCHRMLVLISGLIMNFAVPLSNAAVNNDILYHHHIHNFYMNDWDKTKPNYLAVQNHALAMSYEATTHYLAKSLPGEIDNLKRILLHSAYYTPANVYFSKKQVKYYPGYMDSNNYSTINPARIVWDAYAYDANDIAIFKGFGCAALSNYSSVSVSTTEENAKKMFRTDKDYGLFVLNWESKYVVDELVAKTIKTLQTGRYDYVFFDDLPKNPGTCLNKNFGGKGFYPNWKEGQLAFLQRITDAAHSMTGRKKSPIKVFGNIWSPYSDGQSAKWYAEKKLRLDHYYFESAGFAPADFLYGQTANGRDPETGLPAYIPITGGFIPANLISLSTNLNTMYAYASGKTELKSTYAFQHFQAAGIAAKQGSWFGWYGETSVDKTDTTGAFIHTNAMQLLRSIPDWENLASVPLSSRQYDKATNVYSSPNSKISNQVIQGVNPANNEMYVVYTNQSGQVDLQGKTLQSASYVDDFFKKTGVNALSCLTVSNGKLILKCANKLEKGIRLTLK